MATSLGYNSPKHTMMYIETRECPLNGRYFVLYLYGCIRWIYFLKIWLSWRFFIVVNFFIFVSMVTAIGYNSPKNCIVYIKTRQCPLNGRYFIIFLYWCIRCLYFLKIWLNWLFHSCEIFHFCFHGYRPKIHFPKEYYCKYWN